MVEKKAWIKASLKVLSLVIGGGPQKLGVRTLLQNVSVNNSGIFFQRFFGKSGKSLAGLLSYTIFRHELDPSQDRVRPFFSTSYVNNF